MEDSFLKKIKIDNSLNEIKSKLSSGTVDINKIDEEHQRKLIKKYKESIQSKKQEINRIKKEILNIKGVNI